MRVSEQVVVQIYPFTATAASIQFSIAAPQRAYLVIQNNGGNPLNVQFGKPNQGGLGDMSIDAGDEFEWKERIPVDGIYLSSTLGTVGVIIEGRNA